MCIIYYCTIVRYMAMFCVNRPHNVVVLCHAIMIPILTQILSIVISMCLHDGMHAGCRIDEFYSFDRLLPIHTCI